MVMIGALLVALVFVGAATARGSAPSDGGTQSNQDKEKKDGQGSDKRAQALSKYLEAKRLEEAGN